MATIDPNLVSRRRALAGLGAGGLGLALTTSRSGAAQDAGLAAANHQILGLWQSDGAFDPTRSYSIFHPDGTWQSWDPNPEHMGAPLGIWRPIDARRVELLLIYGGTDGTATWRVTVDIDETGDGIVFSGTLDVQDLEGNPGFTMTGAWLGTRVTFERNPATVRAQPTPTP